MEKLRPKSNLDIFKTERKRRKQKYGNELKVVLKKCWEIFDRPCGQRLEPLIEDELDKLREIKEITCSDRIISLLKEMSARTIDTIMILHQNLFRSDS